MHEGSIAKNILKVVDGIKKEHNVDTVKEVVVRIGKLHAVVTDSLVFLFDLMKKDYPGLENARLIVEEVMVEGKCKKCGKAFTLDTPVFVCPICGSPDVVVEKGEEMLVVSITAEEETDE